MILCSGSVRTNDTFENAMRDIAGAGFRDVDVLAIGAWAHINPADLAADFDKVLTRVESTLQKNNLTMRAMNIGMNHQMHDRREESIQQNLKELEALCRLMKHFGVTNCALQPLQKDPERDPQDVLKDSVDALEEYYVCARKYGISLGLELHINSPFETIDAVHYVYERIPDATIVFDPTHFIALGGTLNDSEFVMDKAVHVHIRDAGPGEIQTPMGKGAVDFEWIVNNLKARGYAGHFSIEYLHNEEWDALTEAVKLQAKLKSLGL